VGWEEDWTDEEGYGLGLEDVVARLEEAVKRVEELLDSTEKLFADVRRLVASLVEEEKRSHEVREGLLREIARALRRASHPTCSS